MLLLLRRHTTMPLTYIWLTAVRWTSQTGKLLQQGLGVILHEDTTVFRTFSTQRSSSSVTIKHAFVYQKVLLLMLLFRIFWVLLNYDKLKLFYKSIECRSIVNKTNFLNNKITVIWELFPVLLQTTFQVKLNNFKTKIFKTLHYVVLINTL